MKSSEVARNGSCKIHIACFQLFNLARHVGACLDIYLEVKETNLYIYILRIYIKNINIKDYLLIVMYFISIIIEKY